MTKRSLRIGILLVLAAAAAVAIPAGIALAQTQAQTPPPAAQAKPATPPAAPQTPPSPEAQALRAAQNITDADKQIEALKKVAADFPKTSAANSAETLILSALVRKTTADLKAVGDQAKKLAEMAGTPNDRARRTSGAAGTLLGANLMLEDAEQYAKKGLELIPDQKTWIENQKKATADQRAEILKRNPAAEFSPLPTDAEYATDYASAKQSAMMTLAQAYEKRAKNAEAEKAYTDAYNLNPKSGAAAAVKLADYAKAAKRYPEQLEYLTVATLAGRVTAASRADLEAAYKQVKGGTPADLDKMLDERFAKDAPKVEVAVYKPTKARTNRLVVAELFTGSGCPPCVAADMAYDAAIERFAPKDVAVLVYHLHVPRPDPMTSPVTVLRAAKGFYEVSGTPTMYIDGGNQRVGGGGSAQAEKLFKDYVQAGIEKRLEVKPGASVKLQAALKNGVVSVAVDVSKVAKTGKPDQTVRLQVALVETSVHYTGENGVRFHPMVVRSLASEEKGKLGYAVTPGKNDKFACTFDVAKIVADAKTHLDEMEGGSSARFGKFQFIQRMNGIDASKLRVVAFVQDEQTREILQAAFVDLSGAAK